ncbi:hypothetical protein C2845_PM04G33530 [Panicum miliaceum]|uniref:Uncharacterized protein n=1 Tax=Panicum miliaceum TaxID=4540 RepID=A0A3L6QMW1_PANMI|nr:hypothetical protein C2845_PM04G33530 [Panicum miliaceum]
MGTWTIFNRPEPAPHHPPPACSHVPSVRVAIDPLPTPSLLSHPFRALHIAFPPSSPTAPAAPAPEMSDEGGAGEPLSDSQNREIAVWFLSNAPAGEIHYVAKGNPPPPPLFLPILCV